MENVSKQTPSGSARSTLATFALSTTSDFSFRKNQILSPPSLKFSEQLPQANSSRKAEFKNKMEFEAVMTELKAEKWRLESEFLELDAMKGKLMTEIKEREKYERAKVIEVKKQLGHIGRSIAILKEKRGDEKNQLKILRSIYASFKQDIEKWEKKTEGTTNIDANNNTDEKYMVETDGETTEEIFPVYVPPPNAALN